MEPMNDLFFKQQLFFLSPVLNNIINIDYFGVIELISYLSHGIIIWCLLFETFQIVSLEEVPTKVVQEDMVGT